MKILGIDTSSPSGSVALLDSGCVVSESLLDSSPVYSDKLLKEVDGILNRSKTRLNELGGFVITKGPGSFTGLRIGIGAAQGLGMANDIPLIGISSLELLAYSASNKLSSDYFLVCLPTREQEVYFAAYNRDKDSVVLQGRERVLQLNAENENLPTFTKEERIGVGAGWQHREQLESLLDIKLKDCLEKLEVTMEDLCGRALQKLEKGEILAAEALLPNYVKEHLDYHS